MHKLSINFFMSNEGVVAVRANVGTLGKKAFKHDNPLKSVLKSFPLNIKNIYDVFCPGTFVLNFIKVWR